jgi:ABC-type nitrate/sulfonate/bicarbonate transport system substrate-binding protein
MAALLASVLLAIAIIAGLIWDHDRAPTSTIGEKPVATSAGSFVLKLNGPVSPASGAAVVAIADNLFEREGLSVRLLPGTSDADAISVVAADPHAIGVASAQAFLKARAEGLPIVAFASSYVASSVEFFALSSVRLLGPADLEGKRIGYSPGIEPSTVLSAFIAKNFIAQSGLKIVESDGAASDLLNGKIDILVGRWDVEGLMLESSGVSYRSLSPDAFGVHFMGPVFFASKDAFSSPASLERFLIAIANGWRNAYSEPGRTGPIIVRALGHRLNADQLSHFMDSQRRFLRPSGARFGELDPRKLRDLQEYLLQQRIIQQPTDLASAVNLGILAEVYRAKSEPLSPIDR